MLVTAGPTREPIDPVRYISNHSSGKQGYAIADAARSSEPASLGQRARSHCRRLPGCSLCPPMTAHDMLTAVEAALPADIAIFTAAVADWRVAEAGG